MAAVTATTSCIYEHQQPYYCNNTIVLDITSNVNSFSRPQSIAKIGARKKLF